MVLREKERGESHPGFVFQAAAQIAAIRKISVDEVLAAARRNVKEVYNI